MKSSVLSLVTCSYGPDYERCKTLCASVERFVDPAIEHVLIVPKRDEAIFGELVNQRTRVVTVESILPIKAWQLPLQRRWWLTLCSPPVRGWILQQLTKLSAANAVTTDAIVFADSDVVFVRPFGVEHVFEGDRLHLQRFPGPPPKPTHQRWHRESGRLLGIEPSDWYGSDYIGQLVTWRCDTLRMMNERITESTGKHWAKVICNTLHLSEYILYGIYVEHVLGFEEAKAEPTSTEICHCSWHYHSHRDEGELDLQAFLDDIKDHQVAVLIQSNLDIDGPVYRRLTSGQWRPGEPSESPVASGGTR